MPAADVLRMHLGAEAIAASTFRDNHRVVVPVAKIYAALEILPDKAVRELKPGEVSEYTVVRIGDEVTVDLMASAGGIGFDEAEPHIVRGEVQGVSIPFASPLLLWKMKRHTHREKDRGDLYFLRQLLESQGITPPE